MDEDEKVIVDLLKAMHVILINIKAIFKNVVNEHIGKILIIALQDHQAKVFATVNRNAKQILHIKNTFLHQKNLLLILAQLMLDLEQLSIILRTELDFNQTKTEELKSKIAKFENCKQLLNNKIKTKIVLEADNLQHTNNKNIYEALHIAYVKTRAITACINKMKIHKVICDIHDAMSSTKSAIIKHAFSLEDGLKEKLQYIADNFYTLYNLLVCNYYHAFTERYLLIQALSPLFHAINNLYNGLVEPIDNYITKREMLYADSMIKRRNKIVSANAEKYKELSQKILALKYENINQLHDVKFILATQRLQAWSQIAMQNFEELKYTLNLSPKNTRQIAKIEQALSAIEKELTEFNKIAPESNASCNNNPENELNMLFERLLYLLQQCERQDALGFAVYKQKLLDLVTEYIIHGHTYAIVKKLIALMREIFNATKILKSDIVQHDLLLKSMQNMLEDANIITASATLANTLATAVPLDAYLLQEFKLANEHLAKKHGSTRYKTANGTEFLFIKIAGNKEPIALIRNIASNDCFAIQEFTTVTGRALIVKRCMDARNRIQAEIDVLQKLPSITQPNVAGTSRFVDAIKIKKDNIVLHAVVMEKVPGITFYKAFSSPGNKVYLPLEARCYFALQLIGILQELHALGFMHGDFITPNVMIDPDTQKFYLIDFEFSKMFSLDNGFTIYDCMIKLPLKNSPQVAPELCHPLARASAAADVYALGHLFRFLLTSNFGILIQGMQIDNVQDRYDLDMAKQQILAYMAAHNINLELSCSMKKLVTFIVNVNASCHAVNDCAYILQELEKSYPKPNGPRAELLTRVAHILNIISTRLRLLVNDLTLDAFTKRAVKIDIVSQLQTALKELQAFCATVQNRHMYKNFAASYADIASVVTSNCNKYIDVSPKLLPLYNAKLNKAITAKREAMAHELNKTTKKYIC